jgi:hypothetical protein
MQGRAVRAVEVGRAARIDVEAAAAAAAQALFYRLNVRIIVDRSDGRLWTTGPTRIVDAPDTVGLLDCLTDGHESACKRREETATIQPVRPSDRLTLRHNCGSSFTA